MNQVISDEFYKYNLKADKKQVAEYSKEEHFVVILQDMEDLYEKYVRCGCKVTTDSRAISGGEIFFALKGDNFDGNDYALKALEAGAAWAVVDRDAKADGDSRLIRVEDPFRTLQELAITHRHKALGDRHLPLIGLTGTNGKTTTKELICAVLSKKFRVTATKGNLNNDIGVPLSILSIRPDTQIAVIEMGASHPDDIAKLVRVCQPDYGLITNVGKAHLLGFGSLEGVKAAKGELYKWLGTRSDSVIFLNEDDRDLREMASTQPCHCFGYGLRYQNAVLGKTTPESPFLSIILDGQTIRTRLVGAYNATNVLAAMAVGEYFGVPRKDAASAIEEYEPVNNRSQMTRTERNTLIIDAYNANPSSMAAAIDNFAAIESNSKLALLGDMRELGEDSVKEHVEIIRRLSRCGIKAIFAGEEFRKALEAEDVKDAEVFRTSEDMAARLRENPVSGATILIKGSRGMQMEKVIPCL